MNYKNLVKKAEAAQKHSHAPYSNLRVGAALLTSSNKIYTGCNIENSSFSLTICAERTAIFKAISNGERKFKAIAINSDKIEFIPPCGACRQVLLDLAGDIDIVLSNRKGKITVTKLNILLPASFNNSIFKQKK
ncbi:MAG: cytidine deaminase [Ignavibacteriales bacterium]|nr:cytidine deaminase [Ignavibacteriales bacterium]